MSSEEIVNAVVPDQLPTHSTPDRVTFRPWHRVRKEFIRRCQWNRLTRNMAVKQWKRELQRPEDEWSLRDADDVVLPMPEQGSPPLTQPIKCLVIPGDDLLDVRALHRDLQEVNCRIQYLGFNQRGGSDEVGTRVHVSNNEVMSLSGVSSRSIVVRDRFEALASPQSIATQYLKGNGPYHVVNLDLCGSICPNTESDSSSFYQAVTELLAYQCTTQRTEWLLFVTTMVEPKVVHAERFNTLCQPTRRNYDEHEEFRNLVTGIIPEAAFPATPPPPIDVAAMSGEQIIQLFALSFAKWLLHVCRSGHPQWTVAMRNSFTYPMNEAEGAVMLSMAFELKPNLAAPVDSTGMTAPPQTPAPRFPTESECAVSFVLAVDGVKDVEVILKANEKLRVDLRDAQARLLEAAGYRAEDYLKWVADGENSPPAG